MIPMRIRKTPASLLLAGLLMFASANALAGEHERSQLAQLAKEVDYLIRHADDLRSDADGQTPDRIAFRYNDLIHDLTLVRDGISDYIGAELRDGKSMPALDGRYR